MKKTDYIATLPEEVQAQILDDVFHFHFCDSGHFITEEEKEMVLNSRLCDLEEIIDLDDYIKGDA